MLKQSHKNVIKWIIYSILLLLFYVLQTTPGFLQIYGVKPTLILPYAICVAVFEGELAGAIIGIITGMLWDLSSDRLMGYNAIMLMAFCIIAALLVMYLLRANWLNIILICGTAMLIHECLDFLFYYAMWGYSGLGTLFLYRVLPGVAYTTLMSLLMFWLVRKIASVFNEVVRV